MAELGFRPRRLNNFSTIRILGLALTQVRHRAESVLGRVSDGGLCDPRRPCPGLLGLASEAPSLGWHL